jgi:hypothetical protein
MSVTPYAATGICPLAVSSRKSAASRKLPPEPPYSSGICSPYQPSSPIRRATSSECASPSGSDHDSRAAKSRIASTKARCSSLSPCSEVGTAAIVLTLRLLRAT